MTGIFLSIATGHSKMYVCTNLFQTSKAPSALLSYFIRMIYSMDRQLVDLYPFKGMDRLSSKDMDRLKTSLSVRTVNCVGCFILNFVYNRILSGKFKFLDYVPKKSA